MASLGTMKARIANDLARSDLTSEIAAAINDAITYHEGTRFYFNEALDTFTTVADQEWYSATDAAWIGSLVILDSLRVTLSNGKFPLERRTMDWAEWYSSGTTTTGDPTDYCLYRQQIRLYPIPNQARTMTGSFVQRLAALSDDASENAWTTDAEALIRTRAKIILWQEVIRGEGGERNAAGLRLIEQEHLRRLQRETIFRSGSGFVEASYL